MKANRIVYLLGLLVSLSSCEIPFEFEEPQPQGINNETAFKKRIQGTYLNLSDSSFLVIEDTEIFSEWKLLYKMSRAQYDTSELKEDVNNSIFNNQESSWSKSSMNMKFEGDSVVITGTLSQRRFSISESTVLRYFKGIYYLNFQKEDGFWTVWTLQPKRKGELIMTEIAGGVDEVNALQEYTDVDTEGAPPEEAQVYRLRPTRKQMNKISQSNLFSGREVKFLKVKIEE